MPQNDPALEKIDQEIKWHKDLVGDLTRARQAYLEQKFGISPGDIIRTAKGLEGRVQEVQFWSDAPGFLKINPRKADGTFGLRSRSVFFSDKWEKIDIEA